MSEKKSKLLCETTPWVIPNYGCASFNARGGCCRGSLEIDKNKYCLKCKCLYPDNVFSDNESDGVKK